jgi:hypothetical protein
MNKSVNVVLGHSLRYAFNAMDVYILEVKVLGWVVSSDQVVHNIRMANAFFDRGGVAEVHFLSG